MTRELQREHPSALKMFEEIEIKLKGKEIAVFLDYDGTLSPIVDDPDVAFMSDAVRTFSLLFFVFSLPCGSFLLDAQMRDAVRDVARCFPTAIVSGRGKDKVSYFHYLSLFFLFLIVRRVTDFHDFSDRSLTS